MKTKATILTLLVLTVACAFTWPRKTTITPPGTYEVSENLYYDKDVMSNFDWLEYTHWLSRIYGKESAEYKAAQPMLMFGAKNLFVYFNLENTTEIIKLTKIFL